MVKLEYVSSSCVLLLLYCYWYYWMMEGSFLMVGGLRDWFMEVMMFVSCWWGVIVGWVRKCRGRRRRMDILWWGMCFMWCGFGKCGFIFKVIVGVFLWLLFLVKLLRIGLCLRVFFRCVIFGICIRNCKLLYLWILIGFCDWYVFVLWVVGYSFFLWFWN